MAQARRRAVRPRRSGQPGGPSVSWLWLAVLVLIGVAVLAGRSLGRPTPTESAPTATRAPLATSTPLAEVRLEPGARPLATAAPTTARAAPVAATPTAVLSAVRPTPLAGAATVAPNARGAPTPAALAAPSAVAITATPATASGAPRTLAVTDSVALTFDAGADRGYAEDILDLLQEEHVTASFGITGQWARANPDLVRRMAADGHLVFNHTLDHRSFTGLSDSLGGLSPSARRAELEEADAIIAPLIGHSTRPYYRLPYGDDDARVAADVLPAGYSHKVGWTIDSLGWKGAQSTDIVARCLKLAAPAAIYVLHVGRASQDAIALPQVIRGLRDRGYGFHRVDQS